MLRAKQIKLDEMLRQDSNQHLAAHPQEGCHGFYSSSSLVLLRFLKISKFSDGGVKALLTVKMNPL